MLSLLSEINENSGGKYTKKLDQLLLFTNCSGPSNYLETRFRSHWTHRRLKSPMDCARWITKGVLNRTFRSTYLLKKEFRCKGTKPISSNNIKGNAMAQGPRNPVDVLKSHVRLNCKDKIEFL